MAGSEWFGRENELVNLYAAFLLRGHSGIKPGQIGIEVAVRQLREEGDKTKKEVVRKDLVLWNEPYQTVWQDREPLNDPVAVIEFKVNDHKKCGVDLVWLRAFTTTYPTVVGYSVCGYVKKRRGLRYARILRGQVATERSIPDKAEE